MSEFLWWRVRAEPGFERTGEAIQWSSPNRWALQRRDSALRPAPELLLGLELHLALELVVALPPPVELHREQQHRGRQGQRWPVVQRGSRVWAWLLEHRVLPGQTLLLAGWDRPMAIHLLQVPARQIE